MEIIMTYFDKNVSGTGITAEELDKMLASYNIGKKPLARLLGWSDTTIILYSGEGLPKNEYTCRLKELYKDPDLYTEILLSNKEKISPVALRKSCEALNSMFPLTSIGEAARYVTYYFGRSASQQSSDDLSLLRLETILFWSQIISLCLFEKPLFDEDYQPGRSGLPFRSIEERLSKYGCIRPEKLYPDDNMFAPTVQEKEILQIVTDAFSWYGSRAIEAITEAEHFRLCGPKGARRRKTASAEIIMRCYGEVFDQARVKKLKDFENYLHKRMTFIRRETING